MNRAATSCSSACGPGTSTRKPLACKPPPLLNRTSALNWARYWGSVTMPTPTRDRRGARQTALIRLFAGSRSALLLLSGAEQGEPRCAKRSCPSQHHSTHPKDMTHGRTLNLGILAHVDAGKTSLTERLLYAAGVIDEIGSVDDGSTQTDTLALERQRGITIKSAVVSFVIDDVTVNLIDTPGHPDFIAEVERVLSVLDGAVLVISAVEGVQAQTRVLMRTLRRLRIPTLIFVNKIDRRGARHGRRAARASPSRLTPAVVPMGSAAAPRHPRRPSSRRTAPATRLRRHGSPTSLAERDDALLAAYVERRARGPVPRGSAASSPRRPGARWCIRCSSARRSPARRGRADGRHRRAAARRRGRRRRPGLRHRVQGRARPGRREDRLRPDVLGHRADARPAAVRRRATRRKVTAISVFDRRRGRASARRSRPGRSAKLWGLGDVRIGDAIGEPRDRSERPTTSRRRRWRRSSCPAGRRGGRAARRARPARRAGPADQPAAGRRRGRRSRCRSTARCRRRSSRRRWPTTSASTSTFRETTTICIERPRRHRRGRRDHRRGRRTRSWPRSGCGSSRRRSAPASRSGCEVELGSMPLAFFKAVEETVRGDAAPGPPRLAGHRLRGHDDALRLLRRGRATPTATFDKSMSSTGAGLPQPDAAGADGRAAPGRHPVYEPMHRFRLEIPADTLGAVLPVLAGCARCRDTSDARGSRTWSRARSRPPGCTSCSSSCRR